MCDKIVDQISLFRAQITNRKFDDETTQTLDSVLVVKDVRSLFEVRSQFKEFLRCESLRIIREITEKAVDEKLVVIDFLVHAFALSDDVEASEKALSCIQMETEIQPPTNDPIEKEQVIEKIKRPNSVAVISAASQSVQAQAAAYRKRKHLGIKEIFLQ